MKFIKKSLLVAAIATALTGCDDDSFTPKEKTSNAAPVVAGNIEVTVNEKDALSFAYLLGTAEGKMPNTVNGPTGVTDADGDFLSVKNLTADMEDTTGFELEGNTILLRPSALIDSLDTGDTHTVVFTYDISDGDASVQRTATINVIGEDFEPVADGDLVANFTKDAQGMVNLLTRASDADGEALVASNIVADSGNPFEIPFTITDNQLNLDIPSIADQIAAGELVTFNYTYDIDDHRFTITRNLTVNVLGVLDVEGAPSTQAYFLSETINEQNGEVDTEGKLVDVEAVYSYDLLQNVIDREGDAMMVNTFQVNGVDGLMPGLTLVDNTLWVYPHAFNNEVVAGQSKDYNITFKMEDENGNVADGVRTLTLTVNGVENNLLVRNGFTNVGFETPAYVGTDNVNADGWTQDYFSWDCPVKNIQESSARTGSYGFRMEGKFCDYGISSGQFIPSLGKDEKYIISYWLRNSTGVNADNPFNNILGEGVGYWAGAHGRLEDNRVDVWKEDARLIDGSEFGNLSGSVGKSVSMRFTQYDGNGAHDIDDFSLVKISAYDVAERNLLSETGTFEAAETIVSSGGGVTEIKTVEANNKLYVDTTGATNLKVNIPVSLGAILPGGRYVASFDIEHINPSVNNSQVWVALSNGSESISSTATVKSAAGANKQRIDAILTEENSRSAEVDWSEETMTLNLTLPQADSQFYIDNVRLYAIP
ncbi:MAG: hypothetical protein ACSHW0_08445 [Thalassotalea sp.]